MKRVLAALLCVIAVLALFPVSAFAYSTVSNKDVALVYPDENDYYVKPFEATVIEFEGGQAIYIMPKPEKGNGHLGSVACGKKVTILAEKNGYFFFVTSKGYYGWNGTGWFDYDKNDVGNKDYYAAGNNSYPQISTKGVRLVFPKDSQYYDEPFTMTVKASRSDGGIYLMPKPKSGNGNLGTVANGAKVTILAEKDGYYFFQTQDGRYGWNGQKWFK